MPVQNKQTHSENPRSTGILIANTGTPAAPTPDAVREFLTQFLADPYVINYPSWLWLPILHGIILRVRPRRSARLYQRIWTDAGSPLLLGTQNLVQKLANSLASHTDVPLHIFAGMRYGEPSIPTALRQLREQGVDHLIVLPLFPQYSGTTTGTILAAVSDELNTWAKTPTLTIISDYHDHPAYIEALAESVRPSVAAQARLLLSFHGIPRSYGEAGDPYEAQCHRTASLLAAELNLEPAEWSLAFQSRFGPQEWLTPYTDQELIRFGKQQLSHLNVACPGFAVDCLETLDEIAHEGAQSFQKVGGGQLNYIPALNDSHTHVEALSAIILEHLTPDTKKPDTEEQL